MRLVVDTSKCIAAGQCVSAAPRVFDQNEDDGIVILLNDNPPPEEQEAARAAARLCPTLAIRIVED